MSTASAPINESAVTWPAPDFLDRAIRLRNELDSAARDAQQKAKLIADVQDTAFARALPTALVAGGAEKLKKISDDQDAATLAVIEKREALRSFLTSERAGFFSERARAHERLRTEIAENFALMQKAATEICARLENLLGVAGEAEREETLLRQWNREVQRFNKTIPTLNVNAVPSAAGIGPGESVRASVEQMIFQDANLRELCRGIIADAAERRTRAWAAEDARVAENEKHPLERNF